MKKLFFILLCSVCVFLADAQNIIRPKIAGPNDLWVNSYNGVLFFGKTDLETRNSGMPMQLRFYYNSSANGKNYGYGLGFSLGYEMRYEVDSDNNIIIETGDGRTDTYTRFGEDFQSPAGVFSKLIYSDGKYVLTEKTGETYEFADANHKKMTAQADRYGNRTTLTYSADSLLTQIKDAVGHTITLEYTNQLLTRASATFHNGSITYAYDSKKRLIKRTDAMGFTTVYDYDRENHLDEITDANGHKTNISYNASGMVSRIKTEVSDKSIRYDGDKTVFIDYTEPQNQYSYYRWDEKGRVIEKVGLCCGIQSKMEYDEDDNVVKRIDANGNVTTYTYDDRGNMLSLTDPLGNSERYTYDEKFNQVTSFTDKNGNNYRFTYNDKGAMISLSGPLGYTNNFTYNDKGWPLTTTDANSNVTSTVYNEDGTTASVMDAAGFTTQYNYDAYGNLMTLTDARNNTTSYSYDNNNQIISQTDALGNVTSVSYDKVGNIVRVKNAKNQITAYTYDALGQILSMTNAAGGTYTYTYDGKGNVLSVTDPMGIKVTQTWNEKNKILSQTNGEGEVTSYDYDAKGNLTTIFRPNGNVVNYFYDQLDRIEQISDNMGMIAKSTYDANGNQLTITDGLDRTMTYQYDALNRKTSETLPSGATTSYAYDNNSNLLTVTDAKSNVTTYTYSSLNLQLTHTNALSAKTVFEYDANGNMCKVTDANGNPTTYSYDALNRNTQITFANGALLQYTYDELGRVVVSKDRAGNEFKYTYNALGNLLSKVYPDNTSNRYTYDATNRMLSAVNDAATVNFVYDRAGRIVSENLNGKVTERNYDVAHAKRTFTYPSGLKVVENLNERNLISSIQKNGEEVVSLEYNVAAQKIKKTYANGISTNYTYNVDGQLDGLVDDHGVLNYKYVYDSVGNIISRQDLNDGAYTEAYEYDGNNQLITFKRGSIDENSYSYDLLGNRIKTITNGIVTNYDHNNVNAYTNISGGLSFIPTYDSNGNMLNDNMRHYKYDYNNNIVGVDDINTYKYDALGRRVGQNDTDFFYLGIQMVEKITRNVITSYLFGNDIDDIMVMKKDNATCYYHTNHIGSTDALTDSDSHLIERVFYDVYGTPNFFDAQGMSCGKSIMDNSILFTGREYDYESGTYYYRARSQHPTIGRFLQKDVMFFVDGMNDYSYVKNIPTYFKDIHGCYPTAYDAVELAKAGYKDDVRDNIGDWKRVNTWDYPNTGFHAALFFNKEKNEFVFSTSGTDDLIDWRDNASQALGFSSPQYVQSQQLAKQLSKNLEGCELTFVGHSLGGGLASVNSLVTGRKAITYNAAGVNLNTVKSNPMAALRYIGAKFGYNIDSHITAGEILDPVNRAVVTPINIMEGQIPTGPALGRHYYYKGEGNPIERHTNLDAFKNESFFNTIF